MSVEGAEDTIDGVDDVLLEAVEAEVSPADPLTVVFTSGTTADPRRWCTPRVGYCARPAGSRRCVGCHDGGRVLSLMPFFWIGGMQEVLAAPQSGATLVTSSAPTRPSPWSWPSRSR